MYQIQVTGNKLCRWCDMDGIRTVVMPADSMDASAHFMAPADYDNRERKRSRSKKQRRAVSTLSDMADTIRMADGHEMPALPGAASPMADPNPWLVECGECPSQDEHVRLGLLRAQSQGAEQAVNHLGKFDLHNAAAFLKKWPSTSANFHELEDEAEDFETSSKPVGPYDLVYLCGHRQRSVASHCLRCEGRFGVKWSGGIKFKDFGEYGHPLVFEACGHLAIKGEDNVIDERITQ